MRNLRSRRGRHREVDEHTTTYAISIRARCTTLWSRSWFSPGLLVSSTNETDRHDITEILLNVALNTINIHTYIDERKWKISKFTKNPHQKKLNESSDIA